MIQQSYNLFNKDTVTEGALSPTTGNVINGGYYVSDFIPVTPGQRLQIKPNIGLTAIYDDELNFIESVNTADFPYLLPPGARYIRTQLSKASLDGKYVYLGEQDLPFVEYGWDYMPEFIEFVRNIAGESSAQQEIKILSLGNSYSNDTFWMLKDIAESAGYKVTVGI